MKKGTAEQGCTPATLACACGPISRSVHCIALGQLNGLKRPVNYLLIQKHNGAGLYPLSDFVWKRG